MSAIITQCSICSGMVVANQCVDCGEVQGG